MRKFYTLISIAMILTSLCASAQHSEGFNPESIRGNMKQGDKAALLMVHFGTTHDDTRASTIEKLNTEAAAAFPELDFFEAYTSRIVMKRLKERNILKQTPHEMLELLRKKGYTHVIVQSSNIIEGVEMEALRAETALMAPHFKEIRTGNPLLYFPEDYKKVIDALSKNYPEDKKSASVLVGHGTYHPATSQYAMTAYMLHREGKKSFFLGTIEGYPAFEDLIKELKNSPYKKLTLIPFMFVAGDHAKNDIAEEWKENLEKEGFLVSVSMKGLGDMPGIRKLFIEKIRFILDHKKENITQKKIKYRNE